MRIPPTSARILKSGIQGYGADTVVKVLIEYWMAKAVRFMVWTVFCLFAAASERFVFLVVAKFFVLWSPNTCSRPQEHPLARIDCYHMSCKISWFGRSGSS